MEAELFAAERCRPAPDGRALLCAANYAREIQGITASQNLPDARNRAPVSPVSLHISDVSAQRKVRGVKRGQETMFGVLSPFVPAGEHRHSPPPKAATDHAMSWQTSPVPGGRKSRLQRRAAVSAEDFASAFGKAERALIACGGTATGTAEVYRQQTVKREGRSAPVEKRVDRPLLGMV